MAFPSGTKSSGDVIASADWNDHQTKSINTDRSWRALFWLTDETSTAETGTSVTLDGNAETMQVDLGTTSGSAVGVLVGQTNANAPIRDNATFEFDAVTTLIDNNTNPGADYFVGVGDDETLTGQALNGNAFVFIADFSAGGDGFFIQKVVAGVQTNTSISDPGISTQKTLKIKRTATGSAEFFVSGVSVGSHTSGSSAVMYPLVAGHKGGGTESNNKTITMDLSESKVERS